ncbi:MAG: HNH endonuclease [Puniceicoccaceae bacterium]
MTLEEVVIELYSLRRDKQGKHERPHKPVMLLAIMDLVELKLVKFGQVPPSEKLKALFHSYFQVVRKEDDKETPQNPFYFMSGESFWKLCMKPECAPIYAPGQPKHAPSWSKLIDQVQFAVIDPVLFAHMANPVNRELLREAIVSRYFSEHREAIRHVCNLNTSTEDKEDTQAVKEPPPGRDAGFRKVVMEVYDHRCAACGLRIRIDNISLVEAAHLIPYSESHNDNPRNGIALCRNHHYAMDRHLIAPCPNGKWRVSSRLDDRVDGQSELIRLDNRSVLTPNSRLYHPIKAALEWREQRLLN